MLMNMLRLIIYLMKLVQRLRVADGLHQRGFRFDKRRVTIVLMLAGVLALDVVALLRTLDWIVHKLV